MHSHASTKIRGPGLFGLALLFVAVLPAAACNRASCAGKHAPTLSTDPNASRITYIEMLDSQSNNPWGLVFALSFASSAGGVGNGNVLVYTGANDAATVPLQNAFYATGLSVDATSGRVAVPLTLSQGGVQDDTVVRLGFQLERANPADPNNALIAYYSNCYSMDIHIDIGLSATGRRELKTKTLWAGACDKAPKPATLDISMRKWEPPV